MSTNTTAQSNPAAKPAVKTDVSHAPIHVWRVPTPGAWSAGYDYDFALPYEARNATHALGVVNGRGAVEWLMVDGDRVRLRLRGLVSTAEVILHFYAGV